MLSAEARKEFSATVQKGRTACLVGHRDVTTPSPLTEKMTLFWHNHFVSSSRKCVTPQLNVPAEPVVRLHALGNLWRIPARRRTVSCHGDLPRQRLQSQGAAHENFASSKMELFTGARATTRTGY